MNTTTLVAMFGTGDTYLTCALVDAFRRHHGREVQLFVKSAYAVLPELFDLPYEVDDALVHEGETNRAMQAHHENDPLCEDRPFFVHPVFVRSGARLDQLTAKPSTSQADMYRVLLRLPPDTALALPSALPSVQPVLGTVLLIPEARSWPNDHPSFWDRLQAALTATGRAVTRNDEAWSLAELLVRCAAAEWVIGPQCGVMSILCAGEFPCRKTLATPSLNGRRWHDFGVRGTYPYAYVTKFAGRDYDVEEHRITDTNHEEVVARIADGVNAQRTRPHDPRPVKTIGAPLSPGDFLDRLAVLTVKHGRFDPERRAAVEREYLRYHELYRRSHLPAGASALLCQLVSLHERAFDVLESAVPQLLAADGVDSAGVAVSLNRDRVALKRRADEVCRAPYTEVKSYYGAEA